jgi:hypothetical protein
LEELFELVFEDWLPAFAALAAITAPPANNIAASAALRIVLICPPLSPSAIRGDRRAFLNYGPTTRVVPRGL